MAQAQYPKGSPEAKALMAKVRQSREQKLRVKAYSRTKTGQVEKEIKTDETIEEPLVTTNRPELRHLASQVNAFVKTQEGWFFEINAVKKYLKAFFDFVEKQ